MRAVATVMTEQVSRAVVEAKAALQADFETRLAEFKREVSAGEGPPTGEGAAGDVYLDVKSRNVYQWR